MRDFLPQHSFLLIAALVLGGLSLALLGAGLSVRRVAVVLAAAAVLGGFYLLFRNGQTAATAAAVASAIGGGRPVLVEVYSDF